MRLVVQKVSQSSVKIEGEIVGAIDKGYMVLVGITNGDDELLVEKMVDKLVNFSSRRRMICIYIFKSSLISICIKSPLLILCILSSNRRFV